MRLPLLLFLVSMPTGAEMVKRCNFESLTNNCKIFSSEAPLKIPVGPKTFVPNYTALDAKAAEAQKSQDGRSNAVSEKIKVLEGAARFKIAAIFDSVPSKEMSPGFKFGVAQDLGFLQRMFGKNAGKEEDPPMTTMYWPPENVKGEIITVDRAKVKARMSQILKPQRLAKLREALDVFYKTEDMDTNFKKKRINPLASEIDVITNERKAEVTALEKAARESVIKSIVGNKPESSWSAAEASAVAKVKSITLIHGDDAQLAQDPACRGLRPNAYYMNLRHSINLCLNFYNLPDATLVAVLGHELGHSIDPCRCQHAVYDFDATKFGAMLDDKGDLRPEIKGDHDLNIVAEVLLDAKYRKATQTAPNMGFILTDPKKLETFTKSGILKLAVPAAPPIRQEKDELIGYLMADVYKCLSPSDGSGFRQVTEAEINQTADGVVAQRVAIADDTYDAKKDKESIVNAYKSFPQCSSPRAAGQMGEAMADWFGTQALADYLEKNPPKTYNEQIGAVGFFASGICLERSKVQSTKSPQSTGQIIDDTEESMSKERGEHPANKNRIEKIYLADPRVAAAMGCEKPKYSNCRHETDRVPNPHEAPRTTK